MAKKLYAICQLRQLLCVEIIHNDLYLTVKTHMLELTNCLATSDVMASFK